MKRIFHTWDKWECYPAGFYGDKPINGMTAEESEEAYRDFLADIPVFEAAMFSVITSWRNSCEHYLTNEKMNRIAWMGQAAMCYYSGIPARFKGGYNLLTNEQQEAADMAALKHINKWLNKNGYEAMSMDEIASKSKANIY